MHREEAIIVKTLNRSLWDLPSPRTISYFWNFGSTLGICLVIQLVTGVFLRFHYTSFSSERFNSVIQIIQEVWIGWLTRFTHINGASIFFLFVYLHLFRGIFFLRAVQKKVWARGVIIIILLIAISFLGYVLPWGQISYWAVAVITNLFSVVPIVGDSLVNWIWGGFSVRSPTLVRFYSLHFLTPFILTFMVIVHLILLHQNGSRNPIGLTRNLDKLPFHPYFSVKDLFFIVGTFIVFIIISFYTPFILGDAVNNIPANAIQTPAHIQPEWYFLSSYAILRSLPRKALGVMALALSVTIFFFLPLYNLKFSTKFSYHRYIIFWIILFSFICLIKIGALPAEEPYVITRKLISVVYFSSIMVLNLYEVKKNCKFLRGHIQFH